MLAIEELSDEPPLLTSPSVPAACKSVAIDVPLPLPLIVSVELVVPLPEELDVAVVPARFEAELPLDDELPVATIRLL